MFKILTFFLFHILFTILLVKFKKNYSNTKIALVATALFYISIIVIAFVTTYTLKSHLDSFDLNNDGFFSEDEKNPEQRKALKAVSSDNGRNLAPFTGIIFSILYFIMVKIILSIFRRNAATKL